MTRVRLYSHRDCESHLPGLGHPESPERVRRVLQALEGLGPDRVEPVPDIVLPSEDDVLGALKWIHDPAYLERVRVACEQAPSHVDSPDCAVSEGSWPSLMAAPGLVLRAALDQASGRFRRGFIAARPPSHHAERNRARGYCFFNGAALAAEVLTRASGGPVLVVDFDAHHGNGTQRHFWERADVGYVSVHEYPAFPGSGGADEIGEGAGRGLTRNVPLAAGGDDAVVATALENALEEMCSRMQPVAVVVSAGFAGHEADAVSGLKMTKEGFRRITRAIIQAADAWAEGRILSVLEGGYDLDALASSVTAHVEVLGGASTVN
ncbi:MAG: histone deacetylase [Acidobacteria bacterium]|nr:histone deacetylase [Acidobacteriota bacterium]